MRTVGLLFALICLTGCVPWTVVPIGEQGEQQSNTGPFDAAAYVDSIWNEKLVAALSESAADLSAAGNTAAVSGSFAVAGTANILRVDTQYRAGKLYLDAAPGDNTADAILLIGPVILGTALRDSAGFIEFSQFTNQLDYADVANELNRRVVEQVVAHLEPESVVGRKVTFLGVATLSAGDLPVIVPVRLEVE